MDLARVYWRGVDEFGMAQADHYYEAMFQRFDELGKAPYKYQAVDHISIKGAPTTNSMVDSFAIGK